MSEESSRTDRIEARIDPEVKRQAEAVLARLGIDPGDAIRLYYSQIVLHDGLPFDGLIPNAETQRAMRALDAGEGTRYPDVESMFRDLGI